MYQSIRHWLPLAPHQCGGPRFPRIPHRYHQFKHHPRAEDIGILARWLPAAVDSIDIAAWAPAMSNSTTAAPSRSEGRPFHPHRHLSESEDFIHRMQPQSFAAQRC